jgi:signal transduction histidine kinase
VEDERRVAAANVGLAAAYFIAAKAGLSLAFAAPQVSAVWPPSGIALGALLILGYRVWPGVWMGAFAANLTAAEPFGTALGIATGNTLEAVAGAWLLKGVLGFELPIERIRDVVAFLIAVPVSTALSASIGVTSLCLGGVQPWSSFGPLWWIWWVGDFIGALLVTPLLLVWVRGSRFRWTVGRATEALALLGGLAVVCLAVFWTPFARETVLPSVGYGVFPFVTWAALRFRQRLATLSVLVASALALGGTIRGLGLFAGGSIHHSVVLLQVFMGFVAATALFLAAATAESQRAEEERATLLAREREAGAAKDRFLAMLSHELRNPLSAILNALEVVRGGAEPPLAERMRGIVERQLGQLARLVDDLLDIARINQGKIELKRERVDLGAVTRRVVEAALARAGGQGLQITVSAPDEPIVLEADADRLEQVIVNLLSNAVKYTPAGGAIHVIARREGEEAVLQVEDQGIGVRPEALENIFAPFVQADHLPDRARDGLGVGLTLVRDIVDRHGGRVSAASAGLGRGSVFTVRLPALGARAADSPAPAITPRANRRRRVLVVDDNLDAAESLALLMGQAGHEVSVAYDGPTALEQARATPPEVVLLDIGLPGGMDGYEVARRLRRDPTLSGAFLVAVTGWGREEDRERARQAGFDRHLVKPVDAHELVGLLS